jgi:hypothetical protein
LIDHAEVRDTDQYQEGFACARVGTSVRRHHLENYRGWIGGGTDAATR